MCNLKLTRISTRHMEVMPYLFRVHANRSPNIFYPSFEVLDGGFWVSKEILKAVLNS